MSPSQFAQMYLGDFTLNVVYIILQFIRYLFEHTLLPSCGRHRNYNQSDGQLWDLTVAFQRWWQKKKRLFFSLYFLLPDLLCYILLHSIHISTNFKVFPQFPRISFLFHNKASFTHAIKLALVKLTILPYLDFGDVIYKIASNTLLSKLDAVYHSAICFVTKAPYTTHHCNLYALVGWPLLHIRHQTHWLRVFYKSLLGKAPPYLSSLVTIAAPTHSMRSSRYISLDGESQFLLRPPFFPVLCCQ